MSNHDISCLDVFTSHVQQLYVPQFQCITFIYKSCINHINILLPNNSGSHNFSFVGPAVVVFVDGVVDWVVVGFFGCTS